MKMKTCIQTLGILALATSLSYGQDAPEKGDRKAPAPAKVFKKLDANTDGAVSLEEFKASPRARKNPERAAKIFAKIDSDSSGSLSLEEFKAHMPEKAPGKGGKKGGRKVG
jgi:hypothetical protein